MSSLKEFETARERTQIVWANIGCWLQAGGRPIAAVRGGLGGCPAPAAGTQWRLPAGAAHSFGATTRPRVACPACDAPADSLPTAATLAD